MFFCISGHFQPFRQDHITALHLRSFRQDFTQQHYIFAISPRLHTTALHLRPFRQDLTQQHYTVAQQHLGDAAELRHFRLLLRAVIKNAFDWPSFLAGANQLRVSIQLSSFSKVVLFSLSLARFPCLIRLPIQISCLSVWTPQSSGAVRESRWASWAPRPNEPYGFCGRKATLNHAYALVTVCS